MGVTMRLKQHKKGKLVALAFAASLGMAGPAQADFRSLIKNGSLYVEGAFGSGQYGPDTAEVNRQFAARGHNVTVQQDRIDTAWAIRGGFQTRCCFGLELGYYDLGDIETQVSGAAANPGQFARDVNDLLPYSIQAVTLLGTFSFSQQPNPHGLHIVGKLGPAWTSGETNLRSSDGTLNIRREFDEVRVAAGIGFRWDIMKHISLSAEALRFDLENDRTGDFIGASLRYSFKPSS